MSDTKELTFLNQAIDWFGKQEVDVTILDMMCELDWERHRAKGVLRSLARKGLIKKTVCGNNREPTLWSLA